MKLYYLLFLSLSLYFPGASQDATRVLFIGNSFTYGNNMPLIVKAFADSAGIPLITGMHAPGGVSVGDTLQGTMAHMNNPALFQLIRSQKWDFAVIQDNQGRFVRDSAVFPGSSKVVQGHLNIMDSVKANNSCAKIILFAGWAFKNGSPPFGNTGIEMIERILINYRVLNDTMKEVIAPIGEAWIKAINHLPSVNLWDADNAHPSYAGSYLTASVIFSAIFNLPAKLLDHQGALAPSTAYDLRGFGDTAVFLQPDHARYNLGGIKKINLQYANGQLSVPGNFTDYTWYKDGIFAGHAPILTLQANGTYRAEIKENDGCLVKTCNFMELTTGFSEENFERETRMYPNPVTNSEVFISCLQKELKNIQLINLAGLEENIHVQQDIAVTRITLADVKPGYYVLIFTFGNKAIRKTLAVVD